MGQTSTVMPSPRVVLDTNVVLSSLLFFQGRLVWLRHAWQTGRCLPVVSQATVQEFIRTLSYAKFRLDASSRKELLADYLPWCETVTVVTQSGSSCRDDKDLPFLHLALQARVEMLITGDKDLLALQHEHPFIITEEKARERFT